jgi:hypothetical protein
LEGNVEEAVRLFSEAIDQFHAVGADGEELQSRSELEKLLAHP